MEYVQKTKKTKHCTRAQRSTVQLTFRPHLFRPRRSQQHRPSDQHHHEPQRMHQPPPPPRIRHPRQTRQTRSPTMPLTASARRHPRRLELFQVMRRQTVRMQGVESRDCRKGRERGKGSEGLERPGRTCVVRFVRVRAVSMGYGRTGGKRRLGRRRSARGRSGCGSRVWIVHGGRRREQRGKGWGRRYGRHGDGIARRRRFVGITSLVGHTASAQSDCGSKLDAVTGW
jgi:hypothetical protein